MGLGGVIAANGAAGPALAEAGEVEVVERMGQTPAYRLGYGVDIGQGDLPRLIDGRLGSGSVLAVAVANGEVTACLVK